MDAVTIEELTKDYGTTRALDAVSWSMPTGQLLGFLGPNGAGKTTTIRILLGFLKATAGRASVLGMDVHRESTRIRRRVGYLSGDVRLYDHLTAWQTIEFVARARGLRDRSEAKRLVDVLQLDTTSRVRGFSKGMRQKLGLIVALMHRPELLILDEPTSSLDPLMQQVLYRELRAAAAEGRTVLFSSHSLSEVQALCDSVVILRHGRVVASKPVADLRSEAGQRVRFRLAAGAVAPRTGPEGFTMEESSDGWLGGRWWGEPETLLAWLATLQPRQVAIEPSDLEDLFLAYYDDRRDDPT